MNYESMPGIRRSDLWIINKSPAHFKYAMTHPREETAALLFGIAAHKYILEKDDFMNEYAVAPKIDRRTKDGKEAFAQFISSAEGKSVVLADDFATIKEMAERIDENGIARKLLTGRCEVPFTWVDEMTGERCKCKVDCLTEYEGEKYLVDYKTTASCEPGAFERACKKYGYQFQAGMYSEGVFQNELEKYKFAFVAQEKDPPYELRIYVCDDEYVNRGYDKFRELIGIYHECKTTNVWYGYQMEELLDD